MGAGKCGAGGSGAGGGGVLSEFSVVSAIFKTVGGRSKVVLAVGQGSSLGLCVTNSDWSGLSGVPSLRGVTGTMKNGEGASEFSLNSRVGVFVVIFEPGGGGGCC